MHGAAIIQRSLFAPSIMERFDAFHAANQHVYTALRDGALALRRRGWRHYGIRALYEGLRFSRALTTSADDFKLNNNFCALYARMLMDREPELIGFFETRRMGIE